MLCSMESLETVRFKAFFIRLFGNACIRDACPIRYSRRAYGRAGLCFLGKFPFSNLTDTFPSFDATQPSCHILWQMSHIWSLISEIFIAYSILRNFFLPISPAYYSCGGFNTPTLCVVTKGIKADCNHLMRTTPPTLASGVLILTKHTHICIIHTTNIFAIRL